MSDDYASLAEYVQLMEEAKLQNESVNTRQALLLEKRKILARMKQIRKCKCKARKEQCSQEYRSLSDRLAQVKLDLATV